MASVSSPETRATRAKRMRDEQLAELGQLRSQQADRARKFATRFASRLADVVGSPAAEMDDAAAQDACAGMLTVAQDMLMAADTTPADRTEALGFLQDLGRTDGRVKAIEDSAHVLAGMATTTPEKPPAGADWGGGSTPPPTKRLHFAGGEFEIPQSLLGGADEPQPSALLATVRQELQKRNIPSPLASETDVTASSPEVVKHILQRLKMLTNACIVSRNTSRATV